MKLFKKYVLKIDGKDIYCKKDDGSVNHNISGKLKKIAAVITHVAFYAGWPKGWAVFNLAKEVWQAKVVIKQVGHSPGNPVTVPHL